MTSISPLAHALNHIVTAGRSTATIVSTNARPLLRGAMGTAADLSHMQTVNTRLLAASEGLQNTIAGALKVQDLPAGSRAMLTESIALLRSRHAAALTQLQGNPARDLHSFGARLYDESQRSIEVARQAWNQAQSTL